MFKTNIEKYTSKKIYIKIYTRITKQLVIKN